MSEWQSNRRNRMRFIRVIRLESWSVQKPPRARELLSTEYCCTSSNKRGRTTTSHSNALWASLFTCSHTHGRQCLVCGGLNDLGHEEGTDESVDTVPGHESWKDVTTEPSIGECWLRGMEAHGDPKGQEEVVRQLPKLVLDYILPYHHRKANQESRYDHNESSDTWCVMREKVEIPLMCPPREMTGRTYYERVK